MREIKLRAWNRELKKFELFELASHAPITTCQIPARGSWNVLDDWEQYTGLEDKNGKEIYEGDKLVHIDRPSDFGVVSFKDGSFVCGVIPVSDYHSSVVKIIGNIHENPELLK